MLACQSVPSTCGSPKQQILLASDVHPGSCLLSSIEVYDFLCFLGCMLPLASGSRFGALQSARLVLCVLFDPWSQFFELLRLMTALLEPCLTNVYGFDLYYTVHFHWLIVPPFSFSFVHVTLHGIIPDTTVSLFNGAITRYVSRISLHPIARTYKTKTLPRCGHISLYSARSTQQHKAKH